METELIDGRAHYFLTNNGGDRISLNPLIGTKCWLISAHEINCTHCGKKTNKAYSGGYCYPCSIKLPECDMCILKPELCHYSLGTCRDSKWGESHCMIPHYIYLANSSGLKVGITRTSQVPTRWIDQGAIAALPILKVQTRHQSGVIEKIFASEIKDKTDWRKMLKGNIEEVDLEEKRDELFELFGDELDRHEQSFGGLLEILEKEQVTTIDYPVLHYPEKVTSLSFEKNEKVGGVLQGIKGQYLIFDTGVINVRSHTGFKVSLEN